MAMACHGFPSWQELLDRQKSHGTEVLATQLNLRKFGKSIYIYIYIYIYCNIPGQFLLPTCNYLCMELLRMVQMKVELAMPWAQ